MGALSTIGAALGGAVEVAKVVFGDKSKRDEYRHLEQASLNEAYGKEFSYQASNRNWFDAFMDGLNRLPRPVITFGVLWLFVIAVRDPAYFADVMRAMQLVPEMLWWLVLTIIAFFFGGRMIDKVRLPKVQSLIVQQPGRQGGARSTAAEPENNHVGHTTKLTGNKSIDDWRSKALGQTE